VRARVAGLCARDATSLFDEAMVGSGGTQTGCECATGLSGGHGVGLGLTKGDGGLVGRKSVTQGTGPIDVSVSVAQSNRACSCGAGLTAALAVVDGSSRTSHGISLASTSRSIPSACCSLPLSTLSSVFFSSPISSFPVLSLSSVSSLSCSVAL